MIDDVLEALRAQAVMTAQSKWIPPHDHQSMGHRLARSVRGAIAV